MSASKAVALKEALGGTETMTRVLAAAVLLGTVASQHPNPSFSRVQRIDLFSALFPNWRFFAPTPAQHDYHFFYRTLDQEGKATKWRQIEVIAGRSFRQIIWFPGRRPEKAVFDICAELITSLDKGFDQLVKLPAYRMLREYMRARISAENPEGSVKGFQFTLARASGYDESENPDILFASPYTPMTPHDSETTRSEPQQGTVRS